MARSNSLRLLVRWTKIRFVSLSKTIRCLTRWNTILLLNPLKTKMFWPVQKPYDWGPVEKPYDSWPFQNHAIVAPLNNQANLNLFKVTRFLARSANIWFFARGKTIRPDQDHTSCPPLKNVSICWHFKTIGSFPCSKTVRLVSLWKTQRMVGCSWPDEQPCDLLPFQNLTVF